MREDEGYKPVKCKSERSKQRDAGRANGVTQQHGSGSSGWNINNNSFQDRHSIAAEV